MRAGDQLVEHQPGGVDIRRGGHATAFELLGRRELGRAHHAALVRREARADQARERGFVHHLRDPEVEHLERAVVAQEQVLGLHVAVNQPRLMGRIEPGQGLSDQAHGLGHGDGPAPG